MLSLDWNATVNSIRETLPKAQFQNWFKPVEFIRADEYTIVLGVPSRFHEDWIRTNYSEQLSQAIKRQCGSELQLEFEVIAEEERTQNQLAATNPTSFELPKKEEVLAETAAMATRPSLRIVEPDEAPQTPAPVLGLPSFSTPFMELEYNHVAYQCVGLFAQPQAFAMNPLVIQGGTGMGKTHLLAEVAKRLQAQNPRMVIRYTSAESFTNELFQHSASKDWNGFRRKYGEEPDCLLFDDLTALATRPKSQELLLHFFNEITSRGGRVVFTTSQNPHRLEGFLEPLKSRILSGLLAEIKPPSFEERVALLAFVASHNQMEVEVPALRTLANQGQNDVRELIGSLVRNHLHAKLQNRTLDCEFVTTERTHLEAPKGITLEEIMSLVEHNFGIARCELLSKSRKGTTTWARQVAMFLARQYTLCPLEEIGKAFGRDHATVIHAFQKVSETMEQHPTRRYEVQFLKGKLQSRMPKDLTPQDY